MSHCHDSGELLRDSQPGQAMQTNRILKRDQFGTIEAANPDATGRPTALIRNTRPARPWARLIARRLAGREARALIALRGIPGTPELLDWNGHELSREWLGGAIMREQPPVDAAYFREALRLLRRIHSRGVVHNDLAKEANCLVLEDGKPAFIDFQIARYSPQRGRVFRMLAREDLRHLLKHKRYYCPDTLSARQRRLLASPSLPSRLWMQYGKPVYHWVTRSMLGWSDREGASDKRD
jgi:RIO-like serine/threonine protein kinase